MNATSIVASDSLSLTPLMTTSTTGERSGPGANLSLNDKIAMFSSMIGCCHYLEQTSNALGFAISDVEQF